MANHLPCGQKISLSYPASRFILLVLLRKTPLFLLGMVIALEGQSAIGACLLQGL